MRKFKVPKQKTWRFEDRPRKIPSSRRQSARSKCVCGYGTEILWWWPWCVVAVTIGVRIHYVMLPQNRWILHPDEIFQSTEVAFSEVYGYGFRPYEYLAAPNNTDIPAEAQLLQSGMYGLRSPVYPQIFMVVLSITKTLGIDQSPFMVCRIFNFVVTSLLPVTVYWFVLKIFRCRLLAFMTCALTAVERHLAVFGTHTIVNSFISPLIFVGLTLILHDNQLIGNAEEEWKEPADKTSDQNGNIISNHCGKDEQTTCDLQQSSQKGIGNRVAETEDCLAKSVNSINLFVSKFVGGVMVGVVSYIRPDSVLFCLSILLPISLVKRPLVCQNRYLMEVAATVLGGAAALVFCVADDFLWYGWGEISPFQWFRFNIISGKSGKLFGVQDTNVYLQVFMDNAVQVVVNLIFCSTLIYSRLKQGDVLVHPQLFFAICFSFILNLALFSSTGHKEKRFIYNLIVIYLFIVSYSIHTIISITRKRYAKTYSSFIAISITICFALLSYSHYPAVNSSSISDWTYGEARDSVDVNMCLDWLRRQRDVSGVYINASLYDTAGFAALEHDVPLLVKIHNEYYLYNSKQQRFAFKNTRIRTILNYSDFIHKNNKLYLGRLLSKDKTFNYIVTKGEVNIPNVQHIYNKEFTHGGYSVFRTDFSSSKWRDLAEALPVGDNATVLEYEANWLITNGLYQLAIERIEGALSLGTPRVRLYQQMFVCYHKLNDKKMLFHYKEECFRKFGRQTCITQQEKIVLHADYDRFYL